MRRVFVPTIVFFSLLWFCRGWAVPAQPSAVALQSDALSAQAYGDYFKAYRDYIALQESFPLKFPESVEGYLHTLFIVGTPSQIQNECGRLRMELNKPFSERAMYLCGLEALRRKEIAEAEGYLKTIDKNSRLFLPSQILRATVDLLKNDSKQALERLPANAAGAFRSLGLEGEFSITRARALVALNKLEDSIPSYQEVETTSPLYIAALEETAWVFFKLRRFESALLLIDIVQTNYVAGQSKSVKYKISASTYFNLKYLRAYIALLQNRNDVAEKEFLSLKKEYSEYFKVNRPSMGKESPEKILLTGSKKWTDIKSLPPALTNYVEGLTQWLSPEGLYRIKSGLQYQIALGHETERLKKFQKFVEEPNYIADVATLRLAHAQSIARNLQVAARLAQKNMDSLTLKTELGRLEIVWLNRTQGIRSMDEVLENYKSQTRAAEEYLDK